jgi:predicted kinase
MAKSLQPRTFIVGGIPGCGKSTVCKLLARRFEHGICVPWDDIREQWVVSGRKLPWDDDPAEAGRQMMLGSQAAYQVARVYADGGFGVVVDGALPPFPEFLPLVVEETRDLDPVMLYLNPRLEVVLQRLQSRTSREDTEIHLGGATEGHAGLERLKREVTGVLFLDNSDLTPEETVEAILSLVGN